VVRVEPRRASILSLTFLAPAIAKGTATAATTHRAIIFGSMVRLVLEPAAHGGQFAGLAGADGEHEVAADEDVDLAEVDLFDVVEVAGGAQHDEHGVAVAFQFRRLVRDDRVFDGQFVQPNSSATISSCVSAGRTAAAYGSSRTAHCLIRPVRPRYPASLQSQLFNPARTSTVLGEDAEPASGCFSPRQHLLWKVPPCINIDIEIAAFCALR
jgi:hypothetical protein